MIKLVFDNELLKEARMEMGLSQQELADIIGVKVHSIYNWESGAFEPCEENIIKLSQLFNIEIAQFLIKKHIEEDNKEKKIKYAFIKELRLGRMLSQKELGELLNVTNTTISKWESGKKGISKKNLQKIADLFNINITELYE